MQIVQYNNSYKEEWDKFVDESKNGTFLIKRDFMEYHADRFQDCSLLFTEQNRILALLPGNIHKNKFYSHQGLTYGGFIMNSSTKAEYPLQWMEELINYFKKHSINKLIYKSIPHIYHRLPSEEDLYALFRINASLSVRNLATVVPVREQVSSSRLKRVPKRRQKENLIVEECKSVDCFWEIIVKDRMERYNVHPLHTYEEINLLHKRFPQNIRLFIVRKEKEILAGSVIFDTGRVTHLQYAAATSTGKDLYATDILYYELINTLFPKNYYFDFGTSNENKGLFLNIGMTSHKEEFGGRSIVYDTYELDI